MASCIALFKPWILSDASSLLCGSTYLHFRVESPQCIIQTLDFVRRVKLVVWGCLPAFPHRVLSAPQQTFRDFRGAGVSRDSHPGFCQMRQVRCVGALTRSSSLSSFTASTDFPRPSCCGEFWTSLSESMQLRSASMRGFKSRNHKAHYLRTSPGNLAIRCTTSSGRDSSPALEGADSPWVLRSSSSKSSTRKATAPEVVKVDWSHARANRIRRGANLTQRGLTRHARITKNKTSPRADIWVRRRDAYAEVVVKEREIGSVYVNHKLSGGKVEPNVKR